MNVADIHVALLNAAPIVGISIGRFDDKSTWRIDFDESATEAEKDAAYALADSLMVDQPSVPREISDRQFFQQLAIDGIITEDQALAANAAVIPAPLLAIIEQLPAGQRFDAKMKISGATTFYREDPLTIGIGQAYGMSPAEIDAFFVAAAAL